MWPAARGPAGTAFSRSMKYDGLSSKGLSRQDVLVAFRSECMAPLPPPLWVLHRPDLIAGFAGPWRGLSNFALTEVWLDGVAYSTVEHAFQAAKTLLPHERELVRQARTPGEAKRLGRRVTLRPDWESVKHAVMADLLAQKFARPRAEAVLLATGEAALIELNVWGDRHWGQIDPQSPKSPRPDPSLWVGENRHGQLLMLQRTVRLAAVAQRAQPVSPLDDASPSLREPGVPHGGAADLPSKRPPFSRS